MKKEPSTDWKAHVLDRIDEETGFIDANRLGAALQNVPPACQDEKRGQTEVV